MTLSKLAELAGVSVSTVSKVFAGSAEISDKTRERVLSIAKKHGCYEKYHNRHYNKRVIAVICPELLGVHYSQMISYMEQAVSKRGDTLICSIANFSPKKQNELLDYYINYIHVDAIVIIEPAEKIKKTFSVPIVQIGMNNESAAVHCVDVDITAALDNAISYLKKLGHKKIGFIGENYAMSEYTHFKEAVERNGLELSDNYIVINDKRFYDCGYYAADKMLLSRDMPTALFAAYSHIAVGVIKRLTEEGLMIPRDISLICMDDINVIPYPSASLSCIAMHLDVLCSEAINLLYRCFENEYDRTKQVITVTRRFEKGGTIGRV